MGDRFIPVVAAKGISGQPGWVLTLWYLAVAGILPGNTSRVLFDQNWKHQTRWCFGAA